MIGEKLDKMSIEELREKLSIGRGLDFTIDRSNGVDALVAKLACPKMGGRIRVSARPEKLNASQGCIAMFLYGPDFVGTSWARYDRFAAPSIEGACVKLNEWLDAAGVERAMQTVLF